MRCAIASLLMTRSISQQTIDERDREPEEPPDLPRSPCPATITASSPTIGMKKMATYLRTIEIRTEVARLLVGEPVGPVHGEPDHVVPRRWHDERRHLAGGRGLEALVEASAPAGTPWPPTQQDHHEDQARRDQGRDLARSQRRQGDLDLGPADLTGQDDEERVVDQGQGDEHCDQLHEALVADQPETGPRGGSGSRGCPSARRRLRAAPARRGRPTGVGVIAPPAGRDARRHVTGAASPARRHGSSTVAATAWTRPCRPVASRRARPWRVVRRRESPRQ